ncbi:hypothetical protein QJ48_31560 [Paenibacillus sp. A3]|uniref:hypothetical protein n=1 Tax=Paenibacillus sp. A3 TaxID=1337054 RepID=UPI0006D56AF7|nr:hypothetical protein [Paenibacillus sp. A3]KPV55737.1 hypothetical protein QJ48_31560 [Paenibacillus sp. A3]
MTRKKTLPSITKPFSHVHATLKTMGFTELPSREGSTYELTFRDSASLLEFPYRIYTHTQENGQTRVDLNEAGFVAQQNIPVSAAAAAQEMLAELQQYMEYGPAKTKPTESTPIGKAMNGKMANNEKEVRQLGKVMASLPTNSQVMEKGMMPDPMQ